MSTFLCKNGVRKEYFLTPTFIIEPFLAVLCMESGCPSSPCPVHLHLKGDRDFGDNQISGQAFPVLTALSKKEMSPFFHLLYALFTCFLGPLSL
jgi:hypothetical protein